ncbi:MAG: DNA repair protein RecN [Gammaproteobacteria bacterium]|nr:DNA repair protein RecN [Gammaproteobacteria bacterium]
MLKEIYLKNFVIIDHATLALDTGMTVITGETGAGKSIIVDAIATALGQRATPTMIREGQTCGEIALTIVAPTAIQTWLTDAGWQVSEELIIRRTLYRDGRSKSFINDMPITLQKLREISDQLVSIHSQHAHQALLQPEQQRLLLDAFAGHQQLVTDVARLYESWQSSQKRYDNLIKQCSDAGTRRQFLDYQLQELTALQLQANEVAELEQTQQRLAHADALLQCCHSAIETAHENDEALTVQLSRLCQQLHQFAHLDEHIKRGAELFNEAAIQIEEGAAELSQLISQTESNPDQLATVEARLSTIYDLAHKHRLQPAELPALQQRLSDELHTLSHCDEQLIILKQEIASLASKYSQAAEKLSQSRQQAAKKLAKQIKQNLVTLDMAEANFAIELPASESASRYGNEKVAFLVTTNCGQPLQPLSRVASGGELSRISLAIQVITATKYTIPTLIFDEVDVGIGGATAERVGTLLRQLATQAQLLTITHLGQVAAKGQHHLVIVKQRKGQQMITSVEHLEHEKRVEEIARMIGGVKITDQTLAHADEMLEK